MTQTQSTVELLRERDQAIDNAIAHRESSVLEALLADEFIYTHSNGRSQSKTEFIEAIAKRDDPPERVLSDVQVEQHGDIAVSRGNLDIRYPDERTDLFMRYVRVYREFPNGWRAISHRTVYATDRKPAE